MDDYLNNLHLHSDGTLQSEFYCLRARERRATQMRVGASYAPRQSTIGSRASRSLKLSRVAAAVGFAAVCLLSSLAVAQQNFFVKQLVEKKVTELPSGDLYWRIETFATKEQAQQAAGPLGLVAEYDGKVWLFTLGHAGEASKGTKVAEIGPVPRINAREYLLRVNEAGGPPGSATAAHTHPGSEAFYVITGELSQKTPHGMIKVTAGQGIVGHGGDDTPMVVLNSGSGDLRELALFVVDANRPFSSPAKMD